VCVLDFKMASTLSGPNIEEEYMWSVTLDGNTKEYSWKPTDPADEDTEDEEDPSCKPNHRLLIKTAILHPDAAKDEVTMLQIETKGYKDEKVNTPFLAMKSGVNLQQYVDLLVPDLATIKIVSGAGPITLLGSHCVDFYDYRNYGGDDTLDDEEESENSEDDEMDAEEQETVAVKKEVKKKEEVKEEEVAPVKEGKKTPKKEEAKEEEVAPVKEGKKKMPKKEEAKEEEVAPVKEGKKKTPKKETPKKEVKEAEAKEEKAEDKEESPAKEAKSKTPDSKKRKMSAEEIPDSPATLLRTSAIYRKYMKDY